MTKVNINLHNQCIVIEGMAKSGLMKDYFSRKDTDWSTGVPVQVKMSLYTTRKSDMVVPNPCLEFMQMELDNETMNIVDNRTQTFKDYNHNLSKEDLINDNLLNNVVLRPFQADAIIRILSETKCCAQIATGAGKTMIIAGLIKTAEMITSETLTTVLIVPSSTLLSETYDRLKSYGCDIVQYNETREIRKGKVNITMIPSMINDLNNEKLDTDIVDMVIVDEAHHTTAETYFNLIASFINAKGVYGLSGSLLEKAIEDYGDWSDLHKFTFYESRLAFIFKKCILEIGYDDLVKLGYLTDCKYYQIETNISCKKVSNFSVLAPHTIESNERMQLLADCIIKAIELGYKKFMCYTRSREAGKKFSLILHNRNLKSFLAFGGQENSYFDGEDWITEYGNSLFPKFRDGSFQVMIGTTAVEEGVDIPACDCVVFLAGGQSIRQVLQRAGRGFRLSEGKNYALIIDTYDKGMDMTRNHSNARRKICKTRLKREVKRIKSINELV